MKKILLTATVLLGFGIAHSQNINDNKITFSYIQLPLVKIDTQFDTYEVLVEHNYNQANEDSLMMFEARKEASMNFFLQQMAVYQSQRDSLDKIYLKSLSTWEKNTNAGIKNPDGTAIPKPAPPVFPSTPTYPNIQSPQLHSAYENSTVTQRIALAGYEDGTGGVTVTIKLEPIQNIRIVEKKSGSASSTKWTYNAQYTLPLSVVVSSPSQGILLETTLFTGAKNYKMADQKSQYDHQLYMMDNKAQFYAQLESYARNEALTSANNYLNNQFGFIQKNRTQEIYSVKSYKNYDYTDVTESFSLAVLALQAVGNDRDRDGSMDKLEDAINSIKLILEESSLSDKKTRINPKVTAMLQCNLAELLIWQAEFDKADSTVNIAMNSGEGKAKRHCKNEKGFYADQRKRWNIHY